MERPGRLKRRPPPPSLLICLFLVALTCLMIDPCSCSDGELNLFFLFFLFFPHWFASRMEIAQLEPPTVGSRESKGMRWWWCHQFNNINFILVVCERRKKEEEEEEDSVERWINRKGKQLFLSLAKFFFSSSSGSSRRASAVAPSAHKPPAVAPKCWLMTRSSPLLFLFWPSSAQPGGSGHHQQQ